MADLDRPLVVTSGNRSGEPIVIRDDDARTVLGPLVDGGGVLAHNRPIRSRYDDSVVRGTALPRRARGCAPDPLPLPVAAAQPVRTVALVTPHARANTAFGELARHGGLVDVLPEIGVLTGYAVVLSAIGAWRLHRSPSR